MKLLIQLGDNEVMACGIRPVGQEMRCTLPRSRPHDADVTAVSGSGTARVAVPDLGQWASLSPTTPEMIIVRKTSFPMVTGSSPVAIA